MSERRDITGIARDLGVTTLTVVEEVAMLLDEHGADVVLAVHEPVLGNHELNARGYELLLDVVQNSTQALVANLEAASQFLLKAGLRQDQVENLSITGGTIGISTARWSLRAVLFALDVVTEPKANLTRWSDDTVHVSVVGRFANRQVTVTTKVGGDEAGLIFACVEWPDGDYARVTRTPEELRELAEAVASS